MQHNLQRWLNYFLQQSSPVEQWSRMREYLLSVD